MTHYVTAIFIVVVCIFTIFYIDSIQTKDLEERIKRECTPTNNYIFYSLEKIQVYKCEEEEKK